MKFSSSIEFNAVPEWRSFYIDYESLKKLIYNLERKSTSAAGSSSNPEAAGLISNDPESPFIKALDKELLKIDNFYKETETKLFIKDDQLRADIAGSGGPHAYSDDDPEALVHGVNSESSEDEANISSLPGPRTPRRRRRPSVASHHKNTPHRLSYLEVRLKRELIADYVSFNELLSFVDLNQTGFRKILKKFDKTLGTDLLRSYSENTLSGAYVFTEDARDGVQHRIDRIKDDYATLLFSGDHAEAEEALKGYLREHVVWERNTVWRDMISLQRQAQGVNQGNNMGDKNLQDREPTYFFGIRLRPAVAAWIPYIRVLAILATGALFVIFPVLSNPAQSNCLAIVVTASLLWATEALPLFVTSLLVPFLVVILRVPLSKKGHRMSPKDASAFVFEKMWSPVITVLLGGFALAAALSKYNIAKAMTTVILSRSGSDPRVLILVLMFVAAFMCMWISNVAAPVLLFSVAQPLLRTLPTGDPFGKAIILGIALASNVGGMASPIASPQNIIALQNMHPEPSWGEWFIVSLPVSIISIILIWVMLIITFPPTSAGTAMGHIRSSSEKFTRVHYYILAVTALTIGLWCFSHQLEPYVGDMGVLAFVPLVLLFGSGILSAADFNNFLWTIVALAMGGIVLGKAVESCGLLKTIALAAQAQVEDLGLFAVCAVFGLLVLVIASFVSHTVAAMIVLPLVKSIGEQMVEPHPRVLVMISALLCSGAMALPTSGFPNVAAICMTNEFGTPYLTVGDFITRGVPASFLVYIVVVTVGYFLMSFANY